MVQHNLSSGHSHSFQWYSISPELSLPWCCHFEPVPSGSVGSTLTTSDSTIPYHFIWYRFTGDDIGAEPEIFESLSQTVYEAAFLLSQIHGLSSSVFSVLTSEVTGRGLCQPCYWSSLNENSGDKIRNIVSTNFVASANCYGSYVVTKMKYDEDAKVGIWAGASQS